MMVGDPFNFDNEVATIRPPFPCGIGARHPFVTGSYAYGRPTLDSDVDLVVLMAPQMKNYLAGLGKAEKNDDDLPADCDYDKCSQRWGNLNLILCRSDLEYDYWREGTQLLMQKAPVTREFAVKFLDELWAEKYAESSQTFD